MEITIKNIKEIEIKQVEKLYKDAGWSAYTNDMDKLHQALKSSLEVLSAWDGDELIGLIRAVGDGLTILYIQDILVLKDYQNHGIATRLMQQMLMNYQAVRQKVLLTEEAPDVRHFYEKNDFESCDQGNAVAFARYD